MLRVAFYTLGCKVNQYETEAITELFAKEGYSIVAFEEKADVYVINTCTVTNLSDRKSRQMIRRAKSTNEEAVIVVAGCYAQTAPDEVAAIEGVDLVVGTKDKNKIIELIRKFDIEKRPINVVEDIMKNTVYENLKLETFQDRTRAFIKIQDGCSQFCTYCIIPYARGPIRSRNPEEVYREVKRIADEGYKEIVITGIHIASYGRDLATTSLQELLCKIHEINGIERIRLGSIEPNTITDDFIETIVKLPKLCPQFHLSLQSGCDETLKRMNRKYTTQGYFEAVNKLRSSMMDVAITTDVMVGFPGETEEEFEKTFQFLEKIAFAQMHVFKYSPRKGTPAASYKNQISGQIKEERSNLVIALAEKSRVAYNEGFIGRCLPVLYEKETKTADDLFEGFTPNYIRVLAKGDRCVKGEIIVTKLVKTEGEHFIGVLEG